MCATLQVLEQDQIKNQQNVEGTHRRFSVDICDSIKEHKIVPFVQEIHLHQCDDNSRF